LEDYTIHKDASLNGIKEKEGFHFTKDYDKFWKLNQKYNKYVVSCLPGYSTHCDANHLSPFINWEKIINTDFSEIKEKFIINYS
jgi:hypothetical protein